MRGFARLGAKMRTYLVLLRFLLFLLVQRLWAQKAKAYDGHIDSYRCLALVNQGLLVFGLERRSGSFLGYVAIAPVAPLRHYPKL